MQNNSGPKKSRNPLQPEALGDSPIVWNSGMGDPTLLGANLNGNASFVDADKGVILSTDSVESSGSLYWQNNFDYANDLYIKMTIHASHMSGSGGLGWTLFLGSDTNYTFIDDETGSINVFFDDGFYGNPFTDAVSLWVDGTKVGGEGSNYYVVDPLDNSISKNVEVLFQHDKSNFNYITVFIDGKYICKANLGTWTPGGNFIGVSAASSSDSEYVNNHYIKSMEVRSIVPWINVNYPKIPKKNDKIFILINDTYVDYVAEGSDSGNEPNNIMAYLDANSIAYETFTDISEFGWNDLVYTGRAGYVIIPELEDSDILPDLTSGAKNKINNFVFSGGKLLMFAPDNGDVVPFLNDIFSFSIISGGEGCISEPISLTVAGSALFPSESATIPSLSDTSFLDTSTLPAESVTIYEGSGPNQSVVTMIPYGSGKIYVLGWDWFDAAPIGPEDGGWLNLLESILQS
jgi:hypothetical protein